MKGFSPVKSAEHGAELW